MHMCVHMCVLVSTHFLQGEGDVGRIGEVVTVEHSYSDVVSLQGSTVDVIVSRGPNVPPLDAQRVLVHSYHFTVNNNNNKKS